MGPRRFFEEGPARERGMDVPSTRDVGTRHWQDRDMEARPQPGRGLQQQRTAGRKVYVKGPCSSQTRSDERATGNCKGYMESTLLRFAMEVCMGSLDNRYERTQKR
jgi:hypothetical protein